MGFQEFKYHSVVISFSGDCFSPLGHIVHPHQYVGVTIGCGERSHEIYAPNIKKFDHQNWFQGHHIAARQLPKSLASITHTTHLVCFLEQGRPIETRLQHLHRCLLGRKVTTTNTLMAVAQNSLMFLLRHTLPDYLICTVFEQEGLFPIIGMDLIKEILLILFFPLRWDFSCSEEIGNVSIPGRFFQMH